METALEHITCKVKGLILDYYHSFKLKHWGSHVRVATAGERDPHWISLTVPFYSGRHQDTTSLLRSLWTTWGRPMIALWRMLLSLMPQPRSWRHSWWKWTSQGSQGNLKPGFNSISSFLGFCGHYWSMTTCQLWRASRIRSVFTSVGRWACHKAWAASLCMWTTTNWISPWALWVRSLWTAMQERCCSTAKWSKSILAWHQSMN